MEIENKIGFKNEADHVNEQRCFCNDKRKNEWAPILSIYKIQYMNQMLLYTSFTRTFLLEKYIFED